MGLAKRKQLAFYFLMIGVVVGAVEIGARLIALVALSGETLHDVAAGRQHLIAAAGGEASEYQFESDIQGYDNEVLHPYLGFVFDPAANETQNRRQKGMLEVTPLGFFRKPGERPSYEDATTQIGVFGGSVAMLFSFHGRETLVENLSGYRPELKKIGVRSFALGGYKQPQALMTLNYLLALGEQVDIVVNIDGFNELALGWHNFYKHRVFPSYPRAWRKRIEGLPSRTFLKALAQRDSRTPVNSRQRSRQVSRRSQLAGCDELALRAADSMVTAIVSRPASPFSTQNRAIVALSVALATGHSGYSSRRDWHLTLRLTPADQRSEGGGQTF